MEYMTSYDTGLKTFSHDKNRGKWASPKDFFFACAAHAFKADAIVVMPVFIFHYIGIYTLIPYLIFLAVCVVPIVFIQSFLGQFSGTGYISVFRIAPLFKGIGYVSLVFNFATLTYYSIFSAIPLFYFFNSLRPTIPWSCKGSAEWMEINNMSYSFCTESKLNMYHMIFSQAKTPSVEYFRNHIEVSYLSWQLMFCTCIVWGIVAFVLSKPVESIGRFIKYSFLTVVAIMCICLLRFIFLPGAMDGIWKFLFPTAMSTNWSVIVLVPCMALSTLGPGWGTILTMASYNNFNTNILKYSWVVCMAQLGVILGMAFLMIFIKQFMKTISPEIHYSHELDHEQWSELLRIPTGLTFLEWPHLWNLLFFSMLILGTLNLLVIQLFSLLTSLFDEFEGLRESKQKITLRAIAVLALISMLFCSAHGVNLFGILSKFSVVAQMVLNLLVLVVIFWVYGRERFQRDLNFMTSRLYPTWMVNIVRLVAPIFMIFGLLAGVLFLVFSLVFKAIPLAGWVFIIITSLVLMMSWCLIPGYCILKIKQTTGEIGLRFKRSVQPTDWYPADPFYKQRYEESINSTDISHNLITDDQFA